MAGAAIGVTGRDSLLDLMSLSLGYIAQADLSDSEFALIEAHGLGRLPPAYTR
jgi:hypothetical protein